jgi:hypothetical protein
MRTSHHPIHNNYIARMATQSGPLKVEILVAGVRQCLLADVKAFAEHLDIIHPSHAS